MPIVYKTTDSEELYLAVVDVLYNLDWFMVVVVCCFTVK